METQSQNLPSALYNIEQIVKGMVQKQIPGNHSKCQKELLCRHWWISTEGTCLNVETRELLPDPYEEIKYDVKDLRTDLVKGEVV